MKKENLRCFWDIQLLFGNSFMIHILGIRHHGVGSARNVLARLGQLQPDLLLVEGAPELDAVTNWIGHDDLIPPVAILGYNTDDPQQAAFYPFADYSPEWQAVIFARRHGIKVEMIDAPLFSLSMLEKIPNKHTDKEPLAYFAEIDGFSDSSEWWEYRFEQQIKDSDPKAHFEAVYLVMKSLREENIPSSLDFENKYREAFMRKQIRKALKSGAKEIVIICGAWHAPALMINEFNEKADQQLLKSLPASKIKSGVTWIPWTNSRLSVQSEYGAGIAAPGWYECQWQFPENTSENWLTQVARVFRQRHRDISTSHVIETHRLANALSALRGRSHPNLTDLNEAVISVMCGGDEKVFHLIKSELLVGEKIGAVPAQLPKHPLQNDFEQLTKKYRLAQQAFKKELELDLRKELDLKRSILLHRLEILNIYWASRFAVRSKGTFKEAWRLQWRPEMMIQLIEMGVWGNTIELAAMHFVQHQSDYGKDISVVANLIRMAIPADLFMLMDGLIEKTRNLAAISADLVELMTVVPALAEVSRYGNVRKTDLVAMQQLTKGLIERICIGLPTATFGLNEEAAQKMFVQLRKVNEALRLLNDGYITEQWQHTLHQIIYKNGTSRLLAGCICRLLMESKNLNETEVSRLMSFALSKGNPVSEASAWMEGFLAGSSQILLYDDQLWNLIYTWIEQLEDAAFVDILPVIRRTFSKFSPFERKKIGEKVKEGTRGEINNESTTFDFNEKNALRGLKKTLQLLQLTSSTGQ
ncbi:MAG: DUF5682 family protein [Saprospiraceae bacterium]